MIEPIVQDHGLELVDVEILGGRGARVVRVTIDSPEGDGRVPVEQCVAVSREVGTQLDERDAIAGRYRLEVSSPGLDRMLAREKDFAAAVGKDVRIETRRGHVVLKARQDRDVPEGMVFVPFCFAEAAANILTNPQLDPMGKIPEFKFCAARIEPAKDLVEAAE